MYRQDVCLKSIYTLLLLLLGKIKSGFIVDLLCCNTFLKIKLLSNFFP